MEYEIKLLGERAALTKIFNYFCKTPSRRDRHYAFNTYYLDTPDKDFSMQDIPYAIAQACLK